MSPIRGDRACGWPGTTRSPSTSSSPPPAADFRPGSVLSACETAVAPAWRKADETIGFPAAFLEHGAETVLATLWPVDEWASAALVGRFYREWGGGARATAAQALRAAQRWLRTVTADELYQLLRPLRDDPGPIGDLSAEVRQSLSGLDADARPFAHLQCWAGFTVSGR